MSGSVNKVIILGNCTRDVEVRAMQNGGKVCNLSVATNERWTDKASGEKRERAEFHRVVIFDEKLVEVAEQYLKKGSKVYLEGSLATRKWQDQSGQDRYSTEVVLQKFRGVLVMLDGKSAASDDDGPKYGDHRSGEPGAEQAPETGGGSDDLGDSIPF